MSIKTNMNKHRAAASPIKRKSSPAFKSYSNKLTSTKHLREVTSRSRSSTSTSYASVRYNSLCIKRGVRATINTNNQMATRESYDTTTCCELEIVMINESSFFGCEINERYDFESSVVSSEKWHAWEDGRMDVDKIIYDDDSSMDVDKTLYDDKSSMYIDDSSSMEIDDVMDETDEYSMDVDII